jgi:stage IV sporulation protein FB
MNHRQNPFHWSFSCGTWAGVDVRMSVWMPILLVLICLRLQDLQFGLAVAGIFLLSTLLHEMSHIMMVRATGGMGDEVLLWPLGGLAMVHPAGTFRSQFFTPAAGPLCNLAICLLTAVPLLQSGLPGEVFYPFTLPIAKLSAEPLRDLLIVTFWLNWVLVLINMLPVYPLDCGRMVQAMLATRWNAETTTQIYLKVGVGVGFIGFIFGMFADGSETLRPCATWVVAISAMVLLLNLQESFQLQTSESYDESVFGYDFSQGYTSLERGLETEQKPAKRPSTLQRWRERRKAEKQRRQQEQNAQVQAELDVLLQKIQDHGMESLSDAERRKLKRASDLFREKGKSAQ